MTRVYVATWRICIVYPITTPLAVTKYTSLVNKYR